ncbi:MAG TPA: DUF1801 domain-containing protein [Terriglobales bacterium]|nr:DUF1801 domain-containing protein [Terriglobales bacterium]
MRTAGTNKAVYDLLDPYPPEVQKLALASRKFVLRIAPKAMEMVDTKSKVIGFGFGTGYKDMICSLMPAKTWVTLGIGWGAELPDPQKLTEGSGKVHRHVKLKSNSDLENPALEDLLKASLARSESQRQETKAKSPR